MKEAVRLELLWTYGQEEAQHRANPMGEERRKGMGKRKRKK